jgi:HEAT repeat protein
MRTESLAIICALAFVAPILAQGGGKPPQPFGPQLGQSAPALPHHPSAPPIPAGSAAGAGDPPPSRPGGVGVAPGSEGQGPGRPAANGAAGPRISASAAPAGGGRGRGTPGSETGTKKSSSIQVSVDWEWWWAMNSVRYLNLAATLRRERPGSAEAGEIRNDNPEYIAVSRRELERLRREILPFLQHSLHDESADVRTAALIAVAKCGAAGALQAILPALNDDDVSVRESACLALGILGDGDAVQMLAAIAANTASGRRTFGRDGDIPLATRACAALAIGLIGDRVPLGDGAGASALRTLAAPGAPSVEVRLAAIMAIGIGRVTQAAPHLIVLVRDASESDGVRARALTALGKLGDRSAVSCARVALRDKSSNVRRSAAIALGLLGNANDGELIEALMKCAKTGPDRGERNFAILALGRLGGRSVRPFLRRLITSSDGFERAYGALALGLMAGAPRDAESVEDGVLLHRELLASRSSRITGAYAIALGLAGHSAAAADLCEILRHEGGNPRLRALAAQALGMMRSQDATDLLREQVLHASDVGVRTSAAIALGLLGDDRAVRVLNEVLRASGGNVTIQTAALRGLGLVGDRDAIGELGRALMSAHGRSDQARIFAASALGLMSDKDDVPVLPQIFEDENYMSPAGALTAVMARTF